MKLLDWLLRPLTVDLRALALFRVSLALLVLTDLVCRAFDMKAHYADYGVLPRAALLEKFDNEWHLSLHYLNGSWQAMAILFVVAGVVALGLLVGWRTRLMAVLTWGLNISLQARNPMLLQAGDVLLRLLLFWAMLLPLGARWSVDAGLAVDERTVDNKYRSVAGAALLFQVCFIYWFTILMKSGAEWWPNGTAVYYALHVDTLTTAPGIWFRQFGTLLHWLTYLSMAAELILPVLLLSPVFTTATRLFAIVALTGMHISFGFFMELGNFPWIDIFSLLPFVPSVVFDRAGEKLRTPERLGLTLKVAAGLPEKLARAARSLFLIKETVIEVQPAAPAVGPLWAVVSHDGRHLTEWAAAEEVAMQSPLGGWVTAAFVRRLSKLPRPPFLPGQSYWRGLADKLMVARPVILGPSQLNQFCAAMALSICFWWNLTTVPAAGAYMPPTISWIAHLFRLDQSWGMFAPYPVKDDGYYVVDGVLKDKSGVNVLTPEVLQPANFDRPAVYSADLPNQRWRKYMMNLWGVANKGHRLYYARWLCRRWNDAHDGDKQLDEFHIYYMKHETLPDYAPQKVEKVEIWHHYCFK